MLLFTCLSRLKPFQMLGILAFRQHADIPERRNNKPKTKRTLTLTPNDRNRIDKGDEAAAAERGSRKYLCDALWAGKSDTEGEFMNGKKCSLHQNTYTLHNIQMSNHLCVCVKLFFQCYESQSDLQSPYSNFEP